ncbi:Hypothetical protein CAP_1851 [Chondromyces apiculatus DSM 436]|uniref:Schlafen AlbA-2 domain-containing protein n=1 Tax=Chondromyces apiculatus DSM 436 TaxID=1192034 RepID=A0A017SSQ0_9BACT|nr:ATP-binding protein [Chondromyces apiculatus]EYE99993.1 Hypothetical protein CAP_1851 [Chondromyces apiculatus DSM 436]
MDPKAIQQRIQLGEDSRTALKSTAHGFDAKILARTIAAFANGRGGQIFVGVEDDGTPTGVDRPYRADSVFYMRDASMNREATREELIRLLQSQNVYHDETSLDGATRDDLDPAAIDTFLASLYEPDAAQRRDHYLQALKCIDPDGTPTVAGVLLFGKDPQRWLPDARISAVRVDGTVITGAFADRKEIAGPLFEQLDHALDFIPTPSHVVGMQRVDAGLSVPVLREALVNALAHRDYRAPSQVRLFVFSDRVEVVNPGILLSHLTLDSIRIAGISVRRNPILASQLARVRRTEDLALALPETMQEGLAVLGRLEGSTAIHFAYPAADVRPGSAPFIYGAAERLLEKFRAYAGGPEMRLIRYVGFRLQKKEPPRLDIREVFVPSNVDISFPAARLQPPVSSQHAPEAIPPWHLHADQSECVSLGSTEPTCAGKLRPNPLTRQAQICFWNRSAPAPAYSPWPATPSCSPASRWSIAPRAASRGTGCRPTSFSPVPSARPGRRRADHASRTSRPGQHICRQQIAVAALIQSHPSGGCSTESSGNSRGHHATGRAAPKRQRAECKTGGCLGTPTGRRPSRRYAASRNVRRRCTHHRCASYRQR